MTNFNDTHFGENIFYEEFSFYQYVNNKGMKKELLLGSTLQEETMRTFLRKLSTVSSYWKEKRLIAQICQCLSIRPIN